MSENIKNVPAEGVDVAACEQEGGKVRALLKLEGITKDYAVGKNVTHALKGIDV